MGKNRRGVHQAENQDDCRFNRLRRRRHRRRLPGEHSVPCQSPWFVVWHISRILHSQLGLVKKSTRWVPKLLSTPRRWSRSSWRKKRNKLLSHPPLFIWPCPSRLLPLPQAEEGAGRHQHHPGEVQEGVGGGPEGNQQGGVREGLRALVRVVRKVYSHRRKLCLEIVKNNFPSNYHCLLFINTFRYHLDFTS